MKKIVIATAILIFAVSSPAYAHGRLTSVSSQSNMCPEGQIRHWEGRGIDRRMTCVEKR